MRAALQVTLVIPLYNEASCLHALIESIRQQTLAPAEIIFVDGGSEDDTVALARRLIADDARFRLMEIGRAMPGRGRNFGINAARNEWLALTDAGIRLENTWLERLVEVVEKDLEVSVVYGNYEPEIRTFFESCAALAYPAPKLQRPGGLMRGPSVASMLLKRSVWEATGGFPELRATEDLIFIEGIASHDFKVGWAPSASLWWQLEPTLSGTFSKFVAYSRSAVWAGRQRYWHYGVAKQYLVNLAFVVLALVQSRWWLVVLLIGALARVAKTIWVRRDGQPLRRLFNPAVFLGVALVLLTLDLATFTGWLQAMRQSERPNIAPAAANGSDRPN